MKLKISNTELIKELNKRLDKEEDVTIHEVQQAMMKCGLYLIKEVCSDHKDLNDAEANFLVELNKLIASN